MITPQEGSPTYTSVADVDRGIYASVAAAAAVLTMKKNLIIF
jgi:hypothetical protein